MAVKKLKAINENEIQMMYPINAWKGYILERRIPMGSGRKSDGLLYIIGGKCEYFFENGDSFTVKSGDVFYLANGARYEMNIITERYDFMAVNFFFKEEEGTCRSENFGNMPDCENKFLKAISAWENKHKGYMTETLGILCEIYTQILKNSQSEYMRSASREKIDRAREYMHLHYADEDMSIAAVARENKLSDAHFRRLFVQYIGVSPQEYLINLKINRAKELLAIGLSVSDASSQCGLADQCYFSRIFKKYTGMTPSKYRRDFFE